MRGVLVPLLAVALIAAAPSPTPGDTAPDRFPALLGTWTCRDGIGTTSTLTFARDRDAIVATERVGTTPSGPEQRYRYDARAGRWSVQESGPYTEFDGGAPRWTAGEWDIDGVTRWTGATRVPFVDRPRTIRYFQDAAGLLFRGYPDPGATSHVRGEVCAAGTTAPDPAICPAADVYASTLFAFEPRSPGGDGRVDVVLSLDADSRITGSRVLSSTNVRLNAAALEAVSRSRFRTAYHNCRPVPSEYLFRVQFS